MSRKGRITSYECRVVMEYCDGERIGWFVCSSEKGIGVTYWADSNGTEGELRLGLADMIKAVNVWAQEVVEQQLTLW